jgi:hypothetical protein
MKRERGFTPAWLGWAWLIFGVLGLFGTLSLGNHGIFPFSRGIEVCIFFIIGGVILVGVGNYARR